MKMNRYFAATAMVALVAANTASAGGLTAEVVEPVVVVPVVAPAAATRFTGAYVGASLGYTFSENDRVGVHTPAGTFLGDIGEFELAGPSAALFGGYRWNSGKWVFGPEVSVRFGDVSDDISYAGPIPAASTGTKELNWEAALRATLGYEVTPTTLVYGFLGYSAVEYDYVLNGAITLDETVSQNGLTAGLGVEHALNDTWAVRGLYVYNDYDRENLTGSGGRYTTDTTQLHTVNVGLVYSF